MVHGCAYDPFYRACDVPEGYLLFAEVGLCFGGDEDFLDDYSRVMNDG